MMNWTGPFSPVSMGTSSVGVVFESSSGRQLFIELAIHSTVGSSACSGVSISACSPGKARSSDAAAAYRTGVIRLPLIRPYQGRHLVMVFDCLVLVTQRQCHACTNVRKPRLPIGILASCEY